MDHIRKAVERAKRSTGPSGQMPQDLDVRQAQSTSDPNATPVPFVAQEVTLDPALLENKRIIAHDVADSRSRSFDMLRTQVLQSMDMKSWQFLGTTSATE